MFLVRFGRLYGASLLGSKAFWSSFHVVNNNNPSVWRLLENALCTGRRDRILPLTYEYVKMQNKFHDIGNLALLLVFLFSLNGPSNSVDGMTLKLI